MSYVLLVDDEPTLLDVMRTVFEDDGFCVRTAGNGKAAMQVMELQLPAVVVLDLWMPEMDGRAFLSARGARPEMADLPVVVLTAAFGEPPIEGARVVLPKPCSLEDLLSTVRGLMPAGAPAVL